MRLIFHPSGTFCRYEYSHTDDRLWRKNRNRAYSTLGGLIESCYGVDLNRNFGFHFRDSSVLHPKGGTGLTCVETYTGPKAFSEPETRAIADFIESKRNQWVMYLTYHSYGEKILYPWSYTVSESAKK